MCNLHQQVQPDHFKLELALRQKISTQKNYLLTYRRHEQGMRQKSSGINKNRAILGCFNQLSTSASLFCLCCNSYILKELNNTYTG